MFKVHILPYRELPDDVKSQLSYGDSYGEYILIYHKDRLIFWRSNEIEPEDIKFSRDLSWVPEMIEKAYKLGLKDGNSLDYLE